MLDETLIENRLGDGEQIAEGTSPFSTALIAPRVDKLKIFKTKLIQAHYVKDVDV